MYKNSINWLNLQNKKSDYEMFAALSQEYLIAKKISHIDRKLAWHSFSFLFETTEVNLIFITKNICRYCLTRVSPFVFLWFLCDYLAPNCVWERGIVLLMWVCDYLAPNFVWERGIVLLLWVCLSVCLSFCYQDNSESSRPILMKFGKTLGYSSQKVKFEFEKNYTGRTRTSSNRNFKISITQKVLNKSLLHFTK